MENTVKEWSKVHVCVLSASAIAPILSPMLDSKLGCTRAVVIATKDNEKRFDYLKRVLSSHQIQAEMFVITNPFDIEQLRKELAELLGSLVNERPLVNVTVGTKPLSIVLHEQATKLDFPVYYLNTNDQLTWFWPRHQAPMELEDLIKCEPFLNAHGVEVLSSKNPSMRPELFDIFKKRVASADKQDLLIRDLNRLAHSANDLFEVGLKSADFKNEALQPFLQALQAQGCLKIHQHKVDFINSANLNFAKGGWLEEWVHVHLNRLKKKLPALQHHLSSVELTYGDENVKNEIDNLILYNNNLYIIECKTVRFKAGSKPAGDVIYKLDTLQKQLGGALGRGLLISLYEITRLELERAKQYGIKVIQGRQLSRLDSHITTWLSEKR